MFNSKYYLIVIVIAFVFLAGSVGVQVMEMKEYNLFNSLSNRFLKKDKSSTEAPAAPKSETVNKTAPAEAPAAPKSEAANKTVLAEAPAEASAAPKPEAANKTSPAPAVKK